ncbi:MAG: ATP-binding protein, partial [Polyangiaceae bacterium]
MNRPDLSMILTTHRDQVVARFVADIERKDVSPKGISRSLLVDHIPRFLDSLADELARSQRSRMGGELAATSATAREHGEQRWEIGYDLTALIREYEILRRSILATAKEGNAELTEDDLDILAKCLSVGVEQGVAEYIKFRDEEAGVQKAQLEFLAEVGQALSSSLDYRSTLNHLAKLMVPRFADWCAIHLEGTSADDMLITHADAAKAEVLRSIYRRFPLAPDSPGGFASVMRTGKPIFVAEAEAGFFEAGVESAEQADLARAVGTISWMVVPLTVKGTTIGALTLAYGESQRRYTEADLKLANELARRAAAAIDNAHLYELSQTERSRAESATRAKDELVAMVSHELRTPLNAILGWVRLLKNGSVPESKVRHAFDVIERNADAQAKLVADLLDISRVITGKMRINPSQLDFGNVVEMAVEGQRPAADAKRILIKIDIGNDSMLLRGDGDRLQQVVWNVLSNAVKFTPKDGVIEVTLRKVASRLELTISDDGPGIPEDFLPHVFETFRQFDVGSTRHYGGLGVGLSIAKHLTELHGGVIEAKSAGVGRGATFTMSLPISPLVSTTLGVSKAPITTALGADAPQARATAGVRVLIVDDEADARELIAYVL